MSGAAAGSPARGAAATVLARRGDAGYRQFRIPALLRTVSGTLLAVADGRPLLDDLPSPIDLVIRRSTDGGATFSPWSTLRTGTGLEGFGDASLLQDPTTSRVFCFHVSTTRWGFFESSPGLERTQHVELSCSDDDGLTWRHRRLTGSLKQDGIRSLFAASGSGIVLRDPRWAGRLLQPFVVLLDSPDGTQRIGSAVAFSDDHGETWQLGEPFPVGEDGEHGNEHSLAELPDGRVLSSSRAAPARLQAVSEDGGLSFGAPRPEPAVPDPSDNGSLLSSPGAGWPLVVTHNRHPRLRCDTAVTMAAGAGADGAGTAGLPQWGGAVLLCGGASGYSSAAWLSDGPGADLGVLLERGAYEELVFVRVPASELADAAARPAGSEAVAGGAAQAVAALGRVHSEDWAALTELAWSDSRGETGRLSVRVVPRSITPAPPRHWTFTGEHVVLGGPEVAREAAAQASGSEGKEVGQAGAQVVASREDIAANLAPPTADVLPLDVVALSAHVIWTGDTPVLVQPRWSVDGTIAAPAAELAPGAEHTWLHLSRPYGTGELSLEWEITRRSAD